jgi:hypothetical protein
MLSLERDKPVFFQRQQASANVYIVPKLRALYIFFFPLLSAIVRAAPASDQAALVDDRALERHRYTTTATATASALPHRQKKNCAYVPFTSWPFS